MRALARIAVSLAIVVLIACGQQEAKTYPPQYELNFMRACQALQSTDMCQCAWEKIEREIPPNDFAAFELLPESERRAHPMYGRIERYGRECREQDEAPPEEPPAP